MVPSGFSKHSQAPSADSLSLASLVSTTWDLRVLLVFRRTLKVFYSMIVSTLFSYLTKAIASLGRSFEARDTGASTSTRWISYPRTLLSLI